MPPKSVNSKKAAAMEKKAANEAEKAARKAQEDERKVAASWADGADARSAKRREEQEKKALERDAKKAELKALQEQEEALAAGVKPKVKKTPSKAGKGKNDLAELEAQLRAMEVEKKKKEERKKKAAAASKKKAASRGSDDDGFYSSDDDGLPPLEANPNRTLAGVEQARSMEAAIDLLGGSKDAAAEKHPEKRMKAAYKAYEEAMLVEMKEEMPGLKLSQYKERIFAMWQKAPENPINQAKAAGLR